MKWISILLLISLQISFLFADYLTETQENVKNRIEFDIEKVKERINESNLNNKNDLIEELNNLKARTSSIAYPSVLEGFRATLPFNETIHKDVYKIYSNILKSHTNKDLFVWHTPKNTKLNLFEIPTDNLSTLNIKMMKNEYRYETVNITNSSLEEQTINLNLSNIPSNVEITVFKNEFVDGRRIDPKFTRSWYKYSPGGTLNKGGADALIKLSSPYSFTIPSGTTKQITFLVETKNPVAGNYSVNINLQSLDKLDKNIDLTLNIVDLELPHINHSLNMYDYVSSTSYATTENNREALKKILVSHYGNTPMIKLSRPNNSSFDENGLFIPGSYDFSSLDRAINFFPHASNYFVYPGLSSGYKFADFDMYDPKWELAIGSWAKALSNRMVELGKNPSQLIINSIQEPRTLDLINVGLRYTKAVKKYAPEIRSYATVYGKTGASTELGRELIDNLDIVNIARHHFYGNTSSRNRLSLEQKEFYRNLQKSSNWKKELWFYGTVFSIQSSSEERLLHLTRDFYNNAKGSAYWSLTDQAKNPSGWNMYPRHRPTRAKTRYSPLYIDENSVTTSMQWEAIREGMQNIEYLTMLKNIVQNLESNDYAFDPIQKEEIDNLLTIKPTTATEIEENRLRVLFYLEMFKNAGEKFIYRLKIINGSAEKKLLYENDEVTIKAIKPSANHVFEGWYTSEDNSLITDREAEVTTFTMPKKGATVTAAFKYIGDEDYDGDSLINSIDLDDDNDGIPDKLDAFPFDDSETIDSDKDGIGDNSDLDDDGDGISDIDELKEGTDPLNPNDYLGATRILRFSNFESFGKVELGTSKTKTLTIYNDGNAPITISKIIYLHPSNKNLFTFEPWSGEIAPGASKDIEITYTPISQKQDEASIYIRSDKTSGAFQQILEGSGLEDKNTIDTDNDGIPDVNDLDDDNDGVSDTEEIAQGTNPLDKNDFPSATRILTISNIDNFGQVEVGQTKTQSITLTNTGNTPLSIYKIYAHPRVKKFFTISDDKIGSISPGEHRTVDVTFKPTHTGVISGLLYFKSNKTSGKSTKLISGEGLGEEGELNKILRIERIPSFSEVPVGESKTQILKLYNNGNSPLTITNIYLHPSIVKFYSFEKNWENNTISAGEYKELSITYSPTEKGLKQGLLYIQSNKTSGDSKRLIKGIGI